MRRQSFNTSLERLVTAVTGALPRRDDIGELAARMLAEQMASESEAAKLANPAHAPE